MSQDHPGISPALEEALNGAQIPPTGAAAVALARRYAALLDEPAPAAKYRRHLRVLAAAAKVAMEQARTDRDETAIAEMVEAVTTALAEHSVASDLGPKLLATLQGLGMVLPAVKAPTSDGPATAATSARDELKARRATRADRAKAVDAAPS
jgi:hypothetical protein